MAAVNRFSALVNHNHAQQVMLYQGYRPSCKAPLESIFSWSKASITGLLSFSCDNGIKYLLQTA